MKQVSLQDRINRMRGMFRDGGAEIYAMKPEDYELQVTKSGLNVPVDSFGFLTNQNRLIFNIGQVPVTRHGIEPFVRTSDVTILFGPTFSDALRFGFYRLVCNLATNPEVLTWKDVLQQAIGITRRLAKAKLKDRGHDFEPHVSTDDVEISLNLMRDCGAGTPIVPFIGKVRAKLNLRKFLVVVATLLCGLLGYNFSSWQVGLAAAVVLLPASYIGATRLLGVSFKPPAKAEISPLEHTLLFSANEMVLNQGQKEYQLLLSRSTDTFRITSGSLAMNLALAKVWGWHGGINFFYEAQNGMRGVKLLPGLVLSDIDAQELAPVLREYARNQKEQIDPYIIDAQNLAAFFASGGCEIQFLV